MAFNPFSSFRKYPKIWMASVLLLCMITFVFCMGRGGGGLDDILLGWISGRGASGPLIARLEGRTIHRYEMDQVKRQRNLANDFMRKAIEVCQEQIKKLIKDNSKEQSDPEQEKERRSLITQLAGLRADFEERLKKPRYFEGGVKAQDLLDFMLWQHQADRLGIQLVDESVDLKVRMELSAGLTRWNSQLANEVLYRVRESQHWSATEQDVRNALREEFRVQIAQLALAGARPEFMQEPDLLPYDYPLQYRFPLTPNQLWQYYRQNLSQFDIALLPVKAEHFTSKIKEPTTNQLKELFKKHREDRYDPALDRPGFVTPEKAQISYLMFDSKAKHYQQAADLSMTFQKTPPVFFDAAMPGLGAALRTLSGPKAWEASMELHYEAIRNRDYIRAHTARLRGEEAYSHYALPPLLGGEGFVLPLFNSLHEPSPTAAAGLIAAANQPGLMSAAPWLYQAAAVVKQEKQVAPFIQEQVKKRLPPGLQLFTAGFTGIPFTPAIQITAANMDEQYIPLALVEEKVVEIPKKKLAAEWAVENLVQVKIVLEKDRGVPKGFEKRLASLLAQVKDDRIKSFSTGGLRTPFDIQQDPGMAEFLKQYERYRVQVNNAEGRGNTEKQLKEDDFNRLFFDASEPFSVAGGRYEVRAWPPTVTVPRGALRGNLGAALDPIKEIQELMAEEGEGKARTEDLWRASDSPILFWKTDYESARVASKLEDGMPAVVAAWKLQEARKEALQAAKSIAEGLRKELLGARLALPYLESEAAKLKEKVIALDRVSPLQPRTLGVTDDSPIEYAEYTLKHGVIPYPRPDIVKSLLALNDLRAPLETSVKDQPGSDPALDEINKALFDKELINRRPPIKQVQILTNQPRTIYYVAVVLREYEADRKRFDSAYSGALGNMAALRLQKKRMVAGFRDTPRNLFITDAQLRAGQQYRDALIAQLRLAYLSDENLKEYERE